MRTREIYAKLHEFVVTATGFKDEKVIFANQIAITRPKKPFITIAVSSFRNIGLPVEKKVTSDGEMQTLAAMVCNAGFQCFSDITHEAEEILNELYIKFSTELQNDIWGGLMAAGRTLKHVSAIPVALNEQIESRAILELEIGYMKSTNYYAGVIEEAEIEGIISDQEIRVKKRIL
jgi:hypothetical protein